MTDDRTKVGRRSATHLEIAPGCLLGSGWRRDAENWPLPLLDVMAAVSAEVEITAASDDLRARRPEDRTRPLALGEAEAGA